MSLFKRKPKSEKEQPQKAQPPKAQQPEAVVRRLPQRMPAVFNSIYRAVYSLELSSGVCQLEAGDPALPGLQMAQRDYYDKLFICLQQLAADDSRQLLADLFSRKALAGHFNGGRNSVEGMICLNIPQPLPGEEAQTPAGEAPAEGEAASEEAAEQSPFDEVTAPEEAQPTYGDPLQQWLQIRADRLQGDRPGVYRCVLYLRNAGSEADNSLPLQQAAAPATQPAQSAAAAQSAPADDTEAVSFNNKLLLTLAEPYASVAEYAPSNNRIWTLVKTEDGFRREKPQNLALYLQRYVQNGSIHPGSVQDERNVFNASFINNKIVGGTYQQEVQLKLPGSVEYIWYAEVIHSLGNGHYIRMCRDITKERAERLRSQQMAEGMKLAESDRNMLSIMASLVEFRNVESGVHVVHVREITGMLLRDISARLPEYALKPSQIDNYMVAAVMHDIGKITVPDELLNKPGRFTPEEKIRMQSHTVQGAAIIDRLDLHGDVELKNACHDIALHHHERYDGNGYPEHLKGDEASIGAQAVGLADCYDALVENRVYKKAVPHEKALEMILNGECGAFNPKLYTSLKACSARMRAMYEGEENNGR